MGGVCVCWGGAVWLASHHQLDSGGPASLLALTNWGTGHWMSTTGYIFDSVGFFSLT